MSSNASSGAVALPKERLEVLFEEVAELTGPRNTIDARLVQIAAEIDHDKLCGITLPARSRWRT